MLIAAMILGLVGGISYFIGGCALVSAGYSISLGSQWWVISMIPIGVVGTIGGALAFWKPNLAVYQLLPLSAVLLLLAAVSAMVIGIVSFQQFFGDMPSFMPSFLYAGLPTHPFGGFLLYLPLPLFALIIAGALAMAERRRHLSNPTL